MRIRTHDRCTGITAQHIHHRAHTHAECVADPDRTREYFNRLLLARQHAQAVTRHDFGATIDAGIDITIHQVDRHRGRTTRNATSTYARGNGLDALPCCPCLDHEAFGKDIGVGASQPSLGHTAQFVVGDSSANARHRSNCSRTCQRGNGTLVVCANTDIHTGVGKNGDSRCIGGGFVNHIGIQLDVVGQRCGIGIDDVAACTARDSYLCAAASGRDGLDLRAGLGRDIKLACQFQA